jgi:integrase/recombinase XerC
VRCFGRWLDPRSFTAACEEDVQRFLDERRISARTRYAYLSNLHCFYQCAIRCGLAVSDPTFTILRPKLPRYLPRPIGDGDLQVALATAGTVMRAWIVLGAYGGLRCAEIAKLQRGDVIEGERLLRIHGKGDKERFVPMHPEVEMALRVAGMPRSGPVFRRPRGGPFPPAMVSREISLFLRSVGIDATAHQLRHWFGTKTYQACRDIRVVQELLGHASPTTTAIYTAFSRDDAAAAVMALGLDEQVAEDVA